VGVVTRHRAAWLIPLPLAVASWLGAHSLAYWLVSPGGAGHMGVHAVSGHGHLGYAPALVLLGLALLVAGVMVCVGEGLRGRRPSPPPVRLFVLLPPVGFGLQEHLERFVATGGIPHDLVVEPAFLVGLALQLPFAVAALLLAHLLGALGRGIGRVLARSLAFRRPVPVVPFSLLRLPASATLVTRSVLALGHGPRAPPTGSGW
jgi:hypothetical protein